MTPLDCGADCANCPYSKDGKPYQFVRYSAGQSVSAVLVGESPGQREVEEGEPFVGPTGEKLGEALAFAHIPAHKVAKINVIACKPKEPKDNDEMKLAAKCCEPYFRSALSLWPNVKYLAMGALAKDALGFHGAVQKIRGFLQPTLDYPNAIVTWHPTYAAFHNPFEWGNFLIDVERFGRMLRGQLRPAYESLTPIADASDLAQIITLAHKHHKVYVDIETRPSDFDRPWTGKMPSEAHLHQIGLGVAGHAISIFWANVDASMRGALRLLFSDPKIVKILHNGYWFDIPVLQRYNFVLNNVRDTRDMRRANVSTSKLSLRYLGSISCDIHDWKTEGQSSDGEGEDYEDSDFDTKDKEGIFTDNKHKAGLYNCYDCIVTEHVDNMNMRDHDLELRRGANVEQLYNVHVGLSKFCASMHDTGLYVRRDWLDFMVWFLTNSTVEKEARLVASVASWAHAETDWRATPNGMRALLYARHRHTDWPSFGLPDPSDKRLWTDADKRETISVAEDALRVGIVSGAICDEARPIIMEWLDLQGEKKRLSTLKSDKLWHAIGKDGRLRPGWNSCGTETMRLACAEPNVMNIEQLLRHLFGPAPGKAYVHADKAQLELRVMAVVAEDEVLKQAIRTGDVYSFDAINWFKLPPDINVKKLKPAARQSAKIIHLAAQYSASNPTIWAQALEQDMTFKFSMVLALSQQFRKLYWRTVEYWEEEKNRVLSCGYSSGRILGGRIYHPAPPELSKIANTPIQRTAAEMMNLETLELEQVLRKEVPNARLVAQVHDALDVECDEDDVDKVKAIMLKVMDREWMFCNQTFPFPIEVKVAYSRDGLRGTWAEV